jgi:hypothetical protein
MSRKNNNIEEVLQHFIVWFIVIKPGPGVDPTKGPGPGFHGSTRVDPDQPEKILKNKVLIFHMKKSM